MSSLPTWAVWSIVVPLVLLSPVLAFLLAVGASAFRSHIYLWQSAELMNMANRERALRLEVRVHAPKPSPYGWEIYDGDDAEAQPIKCSQGTYRTEEAAREAGNTALIRCLKDGHATRI